MQVEKLVVCINLIYFSALRNCRNHFAWHNMRRLRHKSLTADPSLLAQSPPSRLRVFDATILLFAISKISRERERIWQVYSTSGNRGCTKYLIGARSQFYPHMWLQVRRPLANYCWNWNDVFQITIWCGSLQVDTNNTLHSVKARVVESVHWQ